MAIDIGDPFPEFSLFDEDGVSIDNASLKGARTVLYFYPKDDTPGCTLEANEFKESLALLGPVRVIGVSPDSPKSHRKFKVKHGLPFTLLADTDHRLAEACGIWVEKSMYGRSYMGVERTTFLLDEAGVVAMVWRKVDPRGHAGEVATACRTGA